MTGGHAGAPDPEWPRTTYFGEPWDVPAVEGARRVPPPVGEPCAWCTVQITEQDRGFLRPHVESGRDGALIAVVRPWHRECELRSVVGSPEHLDGRCFCHTGERDDAPQTPEQVRAEALEVWDRVQRGGVGYAAARPA